MNRPTQEPAEQPAMSHEQAREELSALLDGELNGQERLTLYWHVRSCGACQDYLRELMELRDALREPEELAPPPGFARSVLTRLREERSAVEFAERWESSLHPKREKKPASLRRWAAWGACAAAVLLITVTALRMNGAGGASGASSAPSASSAVRADSAPQAAAGADSAEPAEESAEAPMMAASLMAEEAEVTEDAAASADGDAGAPAAPAAEDMREYATAAAATEKRENGGYVAAEGPETVLLGSGAAEWLGRNGWQGESGDWYAEAEALRSLPEGLSLETPLPDGWDGPVRVETEEALP